MANVGIQDIPPRVLDLLRMLLSANSRNEQAVLVLETRNGSLSTKFKSVESLTGNPVVTSSQNRPSKKVSPSRARRSKLRMEQFIQKKLEKKKVEEANKASSSILTLDCGVVKPVSPGLNSPIPQVDGGLESGPVDPKVTFKFKSEYGEEDIVDTVNELFCDRDIVESTSLVSRVRCEPLSAEHDCCVELVLVATQRENFAWPEMKPVDADDFKELRRI